MESLVTGEKDVIILKAGWAFRQKPLFKKWKKTWLVVSLGGNLKCFSSKRNSSPQKTWNLRQDLVIIKFGKQCRTLLPPPDVDCNCLFELHFTGGKKLSLCAKDIDSAKLWMQALTRAQSDRELPTPKYSRKNRTKEDELKEESLKQNERQTKLWYRFLCCGGSNQVKNFTTPRPPESKSSWT
ncbi:pleckstrin homology domain-containing family B member 2-like [Mercenaria mercenaria]|uniref:pleckstrin homology domain-containing family B member 2-like n=1 Tax=Mercenaria mercenaria TaxID=6596 RepID=UPI001E1D5A4B|nr:pleckstrin homology domain-containing family B member 2-like [Mercenaria mercenaria]XP_045161220.1 pleckstrin homology domain-containing family B member 2-like [Mercenaria mercenaria]XP_053378843.1 pleckstrin homology domain-containing family B member 2-like [Mercenaria mercenaria]